MRDKMIPSIDKLEREIWDIWVRECAAQDGETLKRWQIDELSHLKERFLVQKLPSNLQYLAHNALNQWQELESKICLKLGMDRTEILHVFEAAREEFLRNDKNWERKINPLQNKVWGAVRNINWVDLFSWILPNADIEHSEEYRQIGRLIAAIFYIEMLSKYGHDRDNSNLKKIEARWLLVNRLSRLEKEKKLHALVKKRRENIPLGYKGIGQYRNGIYECNYVSPYTKSADNINADIMFILQDWSSDECLQCAPTPSELDFGYSPDLPTNINLKNLLEKYFGIVDLRETYGTNLFPFIKPGGISTNIPFKDLVQAARDYAIPQIDIVQPKIVICLGSSVFDAILRALGLPLHKTLFESISNPILYNNILVYAQSHPGGMGRATRNKNGIDRVSQDWESMARKYKST